MMLCTERKPYIDHIRSDSVCYFGSNYMRPECLQSAATNLYLWVTVLAVLGCAKKYCGRETAFSRYMLKSSFGFYILHYPVLIVICYILHSRFVLPAICNYLIALTAEFLITPVWLWGSINK